MLASDTRDWSGVLDWIWHTSWAVEAELVGQSDRPHELATQEHDEGPPSGQLRAEGQPHRRHPWTSRRDSGGDAERSGSPDPILASASRRRNRRPAVRVGAVEWKSCRSVSLGV